MLVSGVRSSWLTIERKSSLIRCAACSRAIRSWRSDHSCAFWRAGPARSATASAMRATVRSADGCGAPARGEDAVEPAAGQDRHGQQPVEAEGLHPVGVAGGDPVRRACRRADGGGRAAERSPRRAAAAGRRHGPASLDQLGVRSRRARPASSRRVASSTAKTRRGITQQRCGSRSDRVEGGLAVERCAEVAAEAAEQLALAGRARAGAPPRSGAAGGERSRSRDR